jgi:methylenetetrahydrofolate dehydrogenase (NADP+) / methenyltetrahydrofolate cyclohydrolase
VSAKLIDGKAVAAKLRTELADEISDWVGKGNPAPGLATILVGDDPGSKIYVESKQRACIEVGIKPFDHRLSKESLQTEIARLIKELNEDSAVSGILLQLPTPSHINSEELVDLIRPDKDVDGLTTLSVGRLVQKRPGLRPCTPLGVMELLLRYDVQIEGSRAVIIGRSELVGRPLISLLLAANATVTICHSRTRDLADQCRQADILIAATGVPEMIRGEWIKPGAVVIDVGITRVEEGLKGDIEFKAAAERASLITPVPGGVGPMTIAMLLSNTFLAARAAIP